jgi:mannose-1-phosphate guanylyltransferase
MYEHYYAVIMAGGSGTRLWPLSRHDRPKQSLVVSGGKSLFQHAVGRLEGLFPTERILIVTVADQVEMLHNQCPEIPAANYVIEPQPKGTASVVGLASVAIQARDPEGVMAILTADHLIQNDAHLRQLLRAAYGLAQEDFLVTLGITPDYPATGYGYIQKGDLLGEYETLSAFGVRKFKEKPDQELAKRLVSDGEHVWNSGMFIWKVSAVMAEFQRQMPELFAKLDALRRVWLTEKKTETLNHVWPTIHPQTIDYGIMEHAEKVAVLPALGLGWSDVGSWESMFDALEADAEGNVVMQGTPLTIDTQGTLICGDTEGRLIVTIGVKDLVIVDTGNALLICDRKESQKVRDVVRRLNESGREDFL